MAVTILTTALMAQHHGAALVVMITNIAESHAQRGTAQEEQLREKQAALQPTEGFTACSLSKAVWQDFGACPASPKRAQVGSP